MGGGVCGALLKPSDMRSPNRPKRAPVDEAPSAGVAAAAKENVGNEHPPPGADHRRVAEVAKRPSALGAKQEEVVMATREGPQTRLKLLLPATKEELFLEAPEGA